MAKSDVFERRRAESTRNFSLWAILNENPIMLLLCSVPYNDVYCVFSAILFIFKCLLF